MKNKFGALLKGLLFCIPCGTPMIHTYTMRNSKRYRYYVCYNAQQKGWKNCETKSVPAQAIESAVLDSIRRIGTDPELAEAVAAEALAEVARRRREVEQESKVQRRSLRQLNQNLAREAADTIVDTGARFDRIATLQRDIETTERRLAELTAERTGERVEYAIKLPGRDSNGTPVWLPIDAKFPVEDYQRLVEASERGDVDAFPPCQH